MENSIQSWSILASHFIGDCFDLAKPNIDKDFKGLEPLVRFVLAQLYIDCHLTSESVLILVANGKEWDADIICRSILEGSLKFAFITMGSRDEMAVKVFEYWWLLPCFASGRRINRLTGILEAVDRKDDPNWKSYVDVIELGLELPEIQRSFSKKQKQAMEMKWSFSGIVKYFRESEREELKNLAHLSFPYGMSSHLLHKDADGIGMVWDRSRRSERRRNAAEMGHSARLISDVCAFSVLRLVQLFRICSEDLKAIAEVQNKYKDLFSALKKAAEHFNSVEYPEG